MAETIRLNGKGIIKLNEVKEETENTAELYTKHRYKIPLIYNTITL